MATTIKATEVATGALAPVPAPVTAPVPAPAAPAPVSAINTKKSSRANPDDPGIIPNTALYIQPYSVPPQNGVETHKHLAH